MAFLADMDAETLIDYVHQRDQERMAGPSGRCWHSMSGRTCSPPDSMKTFDDLRERARRTPSKGER
jgi:hypothetical protein